LIEKVSPKSIAMGVVEEVEKTNVLLQQFAIAACSGVSAADFLAREQRVLSGATTSSSTDESKQKSDAAAASSKAKADAAARAAKEKADADAAAERKRQDDAKRAAAAAAAEEKRKADAAAATAAAAPFSPSGAGPLALSALPKLPLGELGKPAEEEDKEMFGGAAGNITFHLSYTIQYIHMHITPNKSSSNV
jgi:hypothetical protein